MAAQAAPDYMILSAVPIQDTGDVLVFVEIQIVSHADLDAADHILQTFDIVGACPRARAASHESHPAREVVSRAGAFLCAADKSGFRAERGVDPGGRIVIT